MPPKKNKKPGRNGFWQFVLEIRDKQPNKHMNTQELQEYAGRKWSAMNKDERAPYEERALLARESYRPAKLTSDGLEIEEVERKEKEIQSKKQEMKTVITRSLKAASFALNLDDQKFIIIHINHLVHYPARDKYFICEVAMAAMSLKNGIEEIYHQIVYPGKLPLGFYGGAMAHSKETHQLIDVVQEDDAQPNTEEVFKKMTRFMESHFPGQNHYIIYSDEKTFEMTNKVIENFCDEFNYNLSKIKVYNLQYLFFALRNAAAGRNIWPTETFSYNELEKDVYCYTPNISCDFHEMSDISLYCSKSIVTRYIYTICDHCCGDLNIQLIPGRHVPNKSKIVEDSRATSKAASISSIDGFRPVCRSRPDTLSSTGYDDNFPALGSSRSSASSVVSFSSMRTGKNAPHSSTTASRIEQSFKAMAVRDEDKRSHRNLKFPEHRRVRDEN